MTHPTPIDIDAVPCRKSPETMFPTGTKPHTVAPQEAAAKAVCRTGNDGQPCPALEPCLRYALHHAVEGIWAATTAKERQNWRARNGVVAVPVPLTTTDIRHMTRRASA